MKGLVRKIIREELIRVFEDFSPEVHDGEDIIYDFDAGSSFGRNKLMNHIIGLNQYYMREYFPSSEQEERWVFELEPYMGEAQVVEILHQLKGSQSYWVLNIAEAVPGEHGVGSLNQKGTTGPVRGYNNFISLVNNKLQKHINPDFL